VLRALVAALIAALVVLPSAGAAPAPKRLPAYCSPSGDVCFGAFKRAGVVRLQITTAARYFTRYTLCLRPPGTGAEAVRRCGSFPLFRGGLGSGDGSVKLSMFPSGQPGVYRATWRLGSGPLGPTLRFRLP
jgi:hypothetical protein